jgi:hypothetical protein
MNARSLRARFVGTFSAKCSEVNLEAIDIAYENIAESPDCRIAGVHPGDHVRRLNRNPR